MVKKINKVNNIIVNKNQLLINDIIIFVYIYNNNNSLYY